MPRVAFLAVVIAFVGCADDDGDGTPYCTGADDSWRPPGHVVLLGFEHETLSCDQSEWDERCSNAADDNGCCGGRIVENRSRVPAECAFSCTPLDETSCVDSYDCFVARENGTNTFLGCYPAGSPGYTIPCEMRSGSGFCTDGGTCVALYASSGPGTWLYATCVSERP